MAPQTTLRMTKQRRVILDELRKLKSHPSADEVYRRVRRFLPRISLGTVYRNLEVLSQEGVVQKVELGGPQRRYDGDITTHYHVRCIECGRVEDAPVKPTKSVEERLRRLSDYEILGHRVEFIGLCPKCKVQRKKRASKK
jgi:Fur family ferric uptake transcriptional regulator